jgi:hypothetical protein
MIQRIRMKRGSNPLHLGVCLFLLTSLLMFQSGCVSLMSNMLYVLKGKDNPAEFGELKEKKVAVFVSHNDLHTWDATSVVLARNINMLLGSKVKKIQLIGQDVVEGMCQDQPLGKVDVALLGSRMGADYILNVNIADLKLREGQTLYRGRCTSSVVVHKIGESSPVFRKVFPEFVYPSTGAPVTDMDEATFQRAYLTLVAERLARVFYPYDPTEDVARDAAITSFYSFQ